MLTHLRNACWTRVINFGVVLPPGAVTVNFVFQTLVMLFVWSLECGIIISHVFVIIIFCLCLFEWCFVFILSVCLCFLWICELLICKKLWYVFDLKITINRCLKKKKKTATEAFKMLPVVVSLSSLSFSLSASHAHHHFCKHGRPFPWKRHHRNEL